MADASMPAASHADVMVVVARMGLSYPFWESQPNARPPSAYFKSEVQLSESPTEKVLLTEACCHSHGNLVVATTVATDCCSSCLLTG